MRHPTSMALTGPGFKRANQDCHTATSTAYPRELLGQPEENQDKHGTVTRACYPRGILHEPRNGNCCTLRRFDGSSKSSHCGGDTLHEVCLLCYKEYDQRLVSDM
jgi:hypothetical protein